MRNLPPLARLRTFEAAARLQSFALAALELHLTASAISHQIRDLERHFGRALFERRHRQVQTTLEGRRLFESLGRLFDALEATCAEVQLPTHDEVLAVHCAPSLALKWLGPRLPSFVAQHPAINIRLTTGADPVDLGVVRDLDVVLSYGAARHKPGLDVVSLGDERIAPLVSPGLLVPREPASRAIQRLTLIDSQLSPVGWAEWFQLNGLPLPLRPRPSFDRAAMAISAAADGMGVALESTRLAAREIERGELVVLGERSLQKIVRPVHFLSVRTTDRARAPVVAFVEWVRAQTA
ncbi:LysR substrate-binding domain-containing protein [Hydrogenophaga sp.]|nr:LysR substrate-binding domain-containing protein [Hydrogenophaga sp.]MDO9133949.1 LysR substrate-binding domain-containing protein [Hydrogenophaga sp.]MDO9504245.1 LysR substrate-binding domain-containing protein [Hydrogenophaga sp.]